MATVKELLTACRLSLPWALGCAFPEGDKCRTILVNEMIISAYGWSREAMLRHDLGLAGKATFGNDLAGALDIGRICWPV